MPGFALSSGIEDYEMRSTQHKVTSYRCMVTELIYSLQIIGRRNKPTRLPDPDWAALRDPLWRLLMFFWSAVGISFEMNLDHYFFPFIIR